MGKILNRMGKSISHKIAAKTKIKSKISTNDRQ